MKRSCLKKGGGDKYKGGHDGLYTNTQAKSGHWDWTEEMTLQLEHLLLFEKTRRVQLPLSDGSQPP